MTHKQYDYTYTQDRELSWLRFDHRVLEEAMDPNTPLMERMKFMAIFTSNLDEFFMIRVGSLYDLSLLPQEHRDNKTGWTPHQQLSNIFEAVRPLYAERDGVYHQLEAELSASGVVHVPFNALTEKEKKFIRNYMESVVGPVLSPQIVDIHHPFPHLINKALYYILQLREEKKKLFGILPIPTQLPRVIKLPGRMRYILLEEVIHPYLDDILDMYKVEESVLVAVTRNADISPEDEGVDVEEDFRRQMKKALKKRARLHPVRLEVQGGLEAGLRKFLCEKLDIQQEQIFTSSAPLDLSYVYALGDVFPQMEKELFYPKFTPKYPGDLVRDESMIRQVQKKDVLLFYPYQSMEPFLQLVKQASEDPHVLSIKITIYRLAKQSRLAEYLVAAAERGKEVTVLMELKARFDEQNNINYAEMLEDAGCTLLYGFEKYKVHSKILLITRRVKNKIQFITQVGTGNYNEKTAKLYTDFSLMTANQEIGEDADAFFKNMAMGNLNGTYRHLLAAPHALKPTLLQCIDHEIIKQQNGRQGYIAMKMNSLTDRALIDKLAEASQAGVKIKLLIRGICCLVPGIAGKTENITVHSIVGRFLEHARVYCFGTGEDQRLYISSADLMTRNMEKRVEIACPVLDGRLRKRISLMMDFMLKDNVKARELHSDGRYSRMEGEAEHIDSQASFMALAQREEKKTPLNRMLTRWKFWRR